MTRAFRNRLIILAISIVAMLVLFIVSMNRSSEARQLPTPSPMAEKTQAMRQALTSTADFGASETAQAQFSLLQTLTATAALPATKTQEYIERQTELTNQQTATAASVINATAASLRGTATQNASSLSNKVLSLYQDGIIATSSGVFHKLKDFDMTWNRPGYFQWKYLDFSPTNFVLRSNMVWETAGEEVSYSLAGCGLGFGIRDLQNHYRVFLNLDGNVRLHRMLNDQFEMMDVSYYDQLDTPDGHAQMILAVENGWINVLINNQLITHVYDENLTGGTLAYAITSGSSINFGMRCQMFDNELWILP
jgi:hypothetical protein